MAEVHERYIRSLEASGVLNRELEALPSDEELAERKAAAGGLTTPELAILLSYTKLGLAHELLSSRLPDHPDVEVELVRYFPPRLRELYPAELRRHPLRREIIVAQVVNELVNRCGSTFVFRLREETGAGADDVARAYTAARDLYDFRELWAEIEALDGAVAARTQVAMLLRARILLERTTRWVLRNLPRPLDIGATVTRFRPGTAALAELLPALLGPGEGQSVRSIANDLRGAGVPAPLAERIGRLVALVPSLDLVRIAEGSGLDVAAVAAMHCALGTRLELHWLRDRIVALPRGTRWEAMARAALRDDVYAEQAALTAEVVRSPAEGAEPVQRVERWLARNADAVDRCLQVLADIRAGGAADLARLAVAVREIRNLIQSSATVGAGRELVAPEPGS